jgi:DNA repair photolyase
MSVIYEPKGKAGEYSELAMNLYRGCNHGCVYCYAPDAIFMDRKEFFENPKPRNGILQKIEKSCKDFKGDPRYILLSFTSDPYQDLEKIYKITRFAIQKLNENNLKYKILTKSNLVIRDFDIIKKDAMIGSTISHISKKVGDKWEPKAHSAMDRIEMLRKAKEAGYYVWVSMEPVYDSKEALMALDYLDFVDEIKIGAISDMPVVAKNINWKNFVDEALRKIEKMGVSYMLKKELIKLSGR